MNDTKAKILAAAEELIIKNGIAETTITKIARKAKVADSLAYQYFKGKEDLIFTIFCERMEGTHELLDEQLKGIIDVKSRLSKMIWHGLRYNDIHKGYVQNLMFGCRSNPSFYKSKAYDLIKKHAQITLNILNQGVQEGIFRKDVDMRIIRDIIYGVTDFEAISCIVTKEIKESSEDLNDILSLILPMIEVPKESPLEDKTERILKSAEKIFSEKGFSGAKIQDIAALADVAEGTIYDYFKNKEDLLYAISESRLEDHINRISNAFHIKTSHHKLRRFLRYHFTLYLQNRDFLRVFILDTLLRHQFYYSKAYEALQNYFKILDDILNEGIQNGSFRGDINKRVFRNMFLGAFTHTALRWIVFPHRGNDKCSEINSIINLFSHAVSRQETA